MLLSILAEGAKPTALGFDATGWVAIGMLSVFGIMLWGFEVYCKRKLSALSRATQVGI